MREVRSSDYEQTIIGAWYGARTMRAVELVAALVAVAGPCSLWAADNPPPNMLKPIQALVAFMARVPANQHASMFADRDVTVVENYPPFIFSGPDAVARWEEGFRKHAAGDHLTELAVAFGEAQDFSVAGDRAYFSLPTTWTGRAEGKSFEEHGAWSFVIVRVGTVWKVLGYGWGVTSYSEKPD